MSGDRDTQPPDIESALKAHAEQERLEDSRKREASNSPLQTRKIPTQVRDAHEATDDKLNELRGMLVAAQILTEEVISRVEARLETDALLVMHNVALAKIEELDGFRRSEWAAIRDRANSPTPGEIRSTRGNIRPDDAE